jgi:hypothetical protein
LALNWETISKKLGYEELHIFGYGDHDLSATRVLHFNQRFNRNDLVKTLSSYRCAVFPYLTGTQSGTLLLAHLGSLASITSDFQGFREYQQRESRFIKNPQSWKEIQKKLSPFMENSYASKMGNSAHKLVPLIIDKARTESIDLLIQLLVKYPS